MDAELQGPNCEKIMSPELETLDQLLTDDMSLATIRQVYPDDTRFLAGMLGLLRAGEIQLWQDDLVVPDWEWHRVLVGGWDGFKVRLTPAGAARIA